MSSHARRPNNSRKAVRMSTAFTANGSMDLVKRGLLAIGYRKDLLFDHYEFADPFGSPYQVQHVDLAAFAQQPASYRSACFGVVVAKNGNHNSPESLRRFQALGAPQLLVLQPQTRKVGRWKMVAQGE